eukprot:7384635-Prymnesium_polylepis.1
MCIRDRGLGGGDGGNGESGGDGGMPGGGGPTKWRGVTPLEGKVGQSSGGRLLDANRHERTLFFQSSCRLPYLS